MTPTHHKRNLQVYDRLWSRIQVTPPQWFSTWPLTRPRKTDRLTVEIGPGSRPRAALAGTLFLDLSLPALKRLSREHAWTGCADGGRLPVKSSVADQVVAFDVLEHLDGDEALFREIDRILKPGGRFLFSVPLHPELFDVFDEVAGHLRRYEPGHLTGLLTSCGFSILHWSAFGSRPAGSFINRLGAWWLKRHPAWCAWVRDVLFRMVGRQFQSPLVPAQGDLGDAGTEVGGVVVVARKNGAGQKAGSLPIKGG